MNLSGFDSLKDLDHSKYFCQDCGSRLEKVDEMAQGRGKRDAGVEVVSCTNPKCLNCIDHPLNPYNRDVIRKSRDNKYYQWLLATDLDSPPLKAKRF